MKLEYFLGRGIELFGTSEAIFRRIICCSSLAGFSNWLHYFIQEDKDDIIGIDGIVIAAREMKDRG